MPNPIESVCILDAAIPRTQQERCEHLVNYIYSDETRQKLSALIDAGIACHNDTEYFFELETDITDAIEADLPEHLNLILEAGNVIISEESE